MAEHLQRKNSLTKHNNTKTHSGMHNNSPRPGDPKKAGAGGKGTWGKAGDEFLGTSPAAADSLDPNYDSDEEIVPPRPLPPVQTFKNLLKPIVEEYFVSGDPAEAVRSIQELDCGQFQHEIVKVLVSKSMDLHDRERELASELLPRLHPDVVPYEKVREGFTALLEKIEDLVLDIPSASDMLANFLARAVVDELLPPKFLSPDSADVELAKETLKKAAATVGSRGAGKRVAHIWGTGGEQSVKRFKERVIAILGEYISSIDFQEADRAVRELAAPSFHYYLVKKAVLIALESNDADRDKIVKLFQQIHKSGLLSEAHIISGFKLSAESIKDIELDTPGASAVLDQFVQRSISVGYLPASFADTYKQVKASGPQKS